MLVGKNVCAVELSALRQDELMPLVQQLKELDLTSFKYISFHAPSSMEPSFEPMALDLLAEAASRKWPIIVHPDAMHTPPQNGIASAIVSASKTWTNASRSARPLKS